MDVLLIRPRSRTLNVIPPVGIGYLLSALIKHDIKCALIDAHKERLSFKSLLSLVKNYKPKIVGFSVYSNEYAWVKQAVMMIKKEMPQVKIILGGYHSSGIPDFIMQDLPEADFIVVGEGEVALPLLANKIINGGNSDFSSIPNLVFRTGNAVIKNEKVVSGCIDDFGMPAWDVLRPDKYPDTPHGLLTRRSPVASIITSRGCPYQCAFCAVFVVSARKIRLRRMDDVVAEIELLHKKYGINEIHIEDENFTFYPERVKEFCLRIQEKKLNLSFACPNGVRLDKVDDEILGLMYKTGFYCVGCGIESGSDKILKDMAKHLDTAIIEKGVNTLKRNKFIVHGYFIVGFPTETREDILKSVAFARILDLDKVFFNRYLPLPGTDDFNRRINGRELKIEGINWDSYSFENWADNFMSINGIPAEELRNIIRKGTRSFYLRPKIIISILKQIRNWEQLFYSFVRFWKMSF